MPLIWVLFVKKMSAQWPGAQDGVSKLEMTILERSRHCPWILPMDIAHGHCPWALPMGPALGPCPRALPLGIALAGALPWGITPGHRPRAMPWGSSPGQIPRAMPPGNAPGHCPWALPMGIAPGHCPGALPMGMLGPTYNFEPCCRWWPCINGTHTHMVV